MENSVRKNLDMDQTIEGEKLKSILSAHKVNMSAFAEAWGVSRTALYNRMFKRTLTPDEVARAITILKETFHWSDSVISSAFQITPTAQLQDSPTLQQSIDALTEAVGRLTEILSQK